MLTYNKLNKYKLLNSSLITGMSNITVQMSNMDNKKNLKESLK